MGKHQGRLELTWTDKDKALLSTGDGKYDYSFVDPSDWRVSEVRLLREVERVHSETRADRPEGLPDPTTDNLLITGDAMHALDALAKIPEYAEQYLGKVTLAYIDPPFNTGQAFDHYEDNIEHSIWLTLLRDRLRQIKPLLADNGSVWVHLDHVESHRCRVVLDEEFGAENFRAEVVWQKADSPRSDVKGFSVSHDTILVYRASTKWLPQATQRTAEMNARFGSQDGDPEPWFDDNPTAPGARSNDETSIFAVQHPITGTLMYPPNGRHWAVNQLWMLEQMQGWAPYKLEDIEDYDARARIRSIEPNRARRGVPAIVLSVPLEEAAQQARQRYAAGDWPGLVLRSGGTGGLGRKARIPAAGRVPETWWSNAEVGHNRQAKAEIKALFADLDPFATPKPERLLERVIQVSTRPGDIVLDCFAGSGTTAAVAHKMGRRWVTSELIPETVATYTMPRLRKVVHGDDPGGISTVTQRVPDDDVTLPEKMTPTDAQVFQRRLKQVLGDADGPLLTVQMGKELAKSARALLKSDHGPLDPIETKMLLTLLKKLGEHADFDATKAVQSQLNRLTDTRDQTTTNWYGGGGFTHLEVAPSMFVEVAGMLLLADWATQSKLSQVMCAQLSVHYEPDGIFVGRKGRTRYVVIDGMVGVSTVEAVVDRLDANQVVEVWTTQAEPGAAEALRRLRPGSSLHAIPAAVIDGYRRQYSGASPFRGAATKEGEGN